MAGITSLNDDNQFATAHAPLVLTLELRSVTVLSIPVKIYGMVTSYIM